MSEPEAFNINRDRGILTPEDRKFLLGETDYKNPQSARRCRARIRQRVTDALLDFEILVHLEDRDRNQIFGAQEDGTEFGGAFARAYLFLYDALVRSWNDYGTVDLNFCAYLEQAVQRGDFTCGYRSKFRLSIEREELDDPAEIFRRAQEDGFQSLTWPEIEYIWFSSEINASKFAAFLSEALDEDIDSQDIRYERRKIAQWQREQDTK